MAESTPEQAPADGYAAAMAELQKILDALEAPDVDVDALATHVDRAAELLRFCRERLVAAETQVTQIVAELDDLGLDADPSDAGPGSDGGATAGDPTG
ncbi:MAG: exodeoxyribonuclease VII small subunit [bacterium]|nr:exodeoxyribonuclease VII small subunit [bacterium]MCY3954081.1 exodeoxyribonuclease VII small subunit [bacterium]MCY4102688.1 exodeoxyribonuclease VII small subunit [bacterium]